jgi:transcriptional regulator GlxA family with amidase domain
VCSSDLARPPGHAELDHHAAALLAAAVRARTAPAPRQGPSAVLVQAALAHMRAGLARPLRIAALAQALGCSPRTLQLAFRSETGRTPADHLAELRLDQATALLLQGRLPLAEVALACGYSEQSALTRAMRRRRGQTPGALRRVPAG